MLTIIILIVNVLITILGIYLFDYRIDGIINNVPLVALSIVAGIIITALLVGLFLEVFYRLLKKDEIQQSMFTHRIAKQIVSVPIHFSLMRIKVIGKENLPSDPGFTMYCNHSSWIDIPIVMYRLYDNPVAALGKEGAFKIFVIGKFAPKFGCVMIHRKDPRQSAEAIRQVISNVKKGFSMLIFPEGTRNKNVDTLLDFKPGAFKAALRSERPIVPITLVKQRKNRWRLIKRVALVIHKPIAFDEYSSMRSNELSLKIRDIIAKPLMDRSINSNKQK